ncbi:hypothetical protein [Enterococcus nangangensis]|nr:hypothetical protein [Enterococcus nangangensis]
MKKEQKSLIYRVAFDTVGNFFIAYNAKHQAKGITVEQAIANLKQTA